MFTADGNRKMVERLKAEKGVDSDGKSLHHVKAGQAASHPATGYFDKLKLTPEGRERLAEIGRKGAAASNKKQGKGGKNQGENKDAEGV